LDLEFELRRRLQGEVLFDDLSRELYSTDASIYRMLPQGVILPETAQDVLRAIEICSDAETSLVARGAGTSLAGQSVGPGVQVDFSRHMNRIVEINAEQRWVRVEPGVVLDTLNAALAPHRLRFGADVATSSRATLGGMIANNSSGARSLVYGMTADHVLELQVALSDGTVATLAALEGQALQEKRCAQTLEGKLYRELPALAEAHAQQIREKFPRVQRRVTGYNLNAFVQTPPVDLTRMLAGSEGTLGLIVEAKLALVPAPASKSLLLVDFDDLTAAASAVPVILQYGPTAVELIDRFIVAQTRDIPAFSRARSFFSGESASVLLIEYWGDSPQDVADKTAFLADTLAKLKIGISRTPVLAAADQRYIWELRKAGVGLLMAVKGDAKPYAFVEDVAVSPENLGPYITRFQQIVAAHGTSAGWYGHASVGCLHIRPLIDLKTAEGRTKLRSIMDQVSDLVLEMKGALSGEHGDGIIRGHYLEKMFGSDIYGAFREVKQLFDPKAVFNPNKIVDTPDILDNLRILPSPNDIDVVNTKLDYASEGGFYRAVEMCSGVGHCRKTGTGLMCPSFMATGLEHFSTRGRANVLRAALEGRLPRQLANDDLYQVLDSCLGCKGCKNECPSSVDMTKYKQEVLFQRSKKRGLRLRDWLVGHIDQFMPSRTVAAIVNALGRFPPLRWFAEGLLGFDRRRRIPAFVYTSFRRRFRALPRQSTEARGEVALFVDCWLDHCQPEVGTAAVRLLRTAGYRVQIANNRCCGRPALSKGLLDRAEQLARANTALLYEHVRAKHAIVVIEPSCLSTLRDDYLYLLTGSAREKAREVASATWLIEEFLAAMPQTVWDQMPLTFFPGQVIAHAHCHQKALGAAHALESALRHIPGIDLTMLDTSCCGMAGAFGYEVEHFELSRACIERALLPALQRASAGTVVVAPGFSCRQQITHFTGQKPLHPVELLAKMSKSDRGGGK
jgi:FAD/FMN-containing dehydrogenase/Fe-S oxidoreductase